MLRYLLAFLLIISITTSATALFTWKYYTSAGVLEQETTVIIPSGRGFTKTIDTLAENKVFTYPDLIKLITYATGDGRRIKAGEYRFPAGITPQEAVRMLVSGQVVVHKITVAEGLNVREVVQLLKAEPVLEGDIPDNIKEGYLFPETYHFTYGDTKASVISRMQEKMQKTLDELWEKRGQGIPLANKEQALVLASVVEKETGIPSERPRVAAVFVNRLKIGMKLQSDPTVAYGIEKATGKPLGRLLTTSDLREPTPYNTYVIDALPPAPIANPSREAIAAVLNPPQTNELYFVATGTGGHNFASTLDEHNRNVRAYREKIR